MAYSAARSFLFAGWPRIRAWRALAFIVTSLAVIYASATTARIVARKYYIFLPGYASWLTTPVRQPVGPTHLLVLFADHFEPNRNAATTQRWLERYAAMAARHRDANGRPPQHTWFYPAEQFSPDVLEALKDATAKGLGEVEFHFHHDYDNEATLRAGIRRGLDRFAAYGFNRTIDGRTQFAFVHGNFGLDNSNGPFFCGVPTELRVLREFGAFADFTFPSIYMDSQPRTVNRLFAVRDDEGPKSYDRPLPLSALRSGDADLMLFQGPLVFAPALNLRRLFVELDDGDIHAAMPADPARIPRWIRANIHVQSRPEWVFIKLFGHGAESPEDLEALTGPDFDRLLTSFESTYNDGRQYVVHYVTAREAYNVAMAAADGHSGNPAAYFNYLVQPYLAGRSGN